MEMVREFPKSLKGNNNSKLNKSCYNVLENFNYMYMGIQLYDLFRNDPWC